MGVGEVAGALGMSVDLERVSMRRFQFRSSHTAEATLVGTTGQAP